MRLHKNDAGPVHHVCTVMSLSVSKSRSSVRRLHKKRPDAIMIFNHPATAWNPNPIPVKAFCLSTGCAHYAFSFAYRRVQSLATSSYRARSFLYCSAIRPSTASSGIGSASSWRANCSTATTRELGFHSSGLSIPRHILPLSSFVTFGWYIFVAKLTAGGLKGYSLGNLSLTRNVPFYFR